MPSMNPAFQAAIVDRACAIPGAKYEEQAKGFAARSGDLRADPLCDCRHCDDYRANPNGPNYHTAFVPGDGSHEYHLARPGTILLRTDFAAQIAHEHGDNLTCASFNHFNCQVFVVSYKPHWKGTGALGKYCADTRVWFAIGGTTPKHEEADSHFHNAILAPIIEYYKEHLPGLTADDEGDGLPLRHVHTSVRFARRFGVSLYHAFAATAHFKGFHDALGKMISDILPVRREEKFDVGQRIEFAYELSVLCRSKLPNVVSVRERGAGLHAVGGYTVLFMTSNPDDEHRDETTTVFVRRDATKHGMGWDTEGVKGSSSNYLYIGDDPTDPEHIRTKQSFCGCLSCREMHFSDCQAVEFTGKLESRTLRFKDAGSAADVITVELRAVEGFAAQLVPGDCIAFGMPDYVENEPLPFSIGIVAEAPWAAEKGLGNADGAGEVIRKGRWCVRLSQWLQINSVEDDLYLERWLMIKSARPPLDFVNEPFGNGAPRLFSFDADVRLKFALEEKGGVFSLSPAEYDRLISHNYARYQRPM
ncbi:hypothetical protein M885DRAFT_580152 [Pelagophyceae sp. CCMP2097]|nr:hypothetical protein M885DRAFT_580152 [Pelagophyceae sp. CCMP2097]